MPDDNNTLGVDMDGGCAFGVCSFLAFDFFGFLAGFAVDVVVIVLDNDDAGSLASVAASFGGIIDVCCCIIGCASI